MRCRRELSLALTPFKKKKLWPQGAGDVERAMELIKASDGIKKSKELALLVCGVGGWVWCVSVINQQ